MEFFKKLNKALNNYHPDKEKELYSVKFKSFGDKLNNNGAFKIFLTLVILFMFLIILHKIFIVLSIIFGIFAITSLTSNLKLENKIALNEEGIILETPDRFGTSYSLKSYSKINSFKIKNSNLNIVSDSLFGSWSMKGFTSEEISKIKNILTQKGIEEKN